MEGANPSSLIPLLLWALWWNSSVLHVLLVLRTGVTHLTHFSWTQLFASPHVGALHSDSDVSVTSCLHHGSLRGCQGSQLDSLWVVQRHGKESRQSFSTALRGVKDAESCVCLGCLWRNWKQERSTQVLWPAPGVAELLLATSKGGTNPKSSCLPPQWSHKFMGKAIFSCTSYF